MSCHQLNIDGNFMKWPNDLSQAVLVGLLTSFLSACPQSAATTSPTSSRATRWWRRTSATTLWGTAGMLTRCCATPPGPSPQSSSRNIRSEVTQAPDSCRRHYTVMWWNQRCLLVNTVLLPPQIDFVAHDDIPYTSAGSQDVYKHIKEAGEHINVHDL